jgi:uncharacterized protein YodC (DUF2158 family)
MAKNKWKPGDKVKLATGGPEMTVRVQTEPDDILGEVVHCQWFDKNRKLQKADFDPDSLVSAK